MSPRWASLIWRNRLLVRPGLPNSPASNPYCSLFFYLSSVNFLGKICEKLRVCEKVREKIEKSYCTVPWGYKILGEKERRLLYYLFVICDYICEMWGKNINIKKKNVKEIGLYIGDRCFLIGWENLGKLPAAWNFYFNDGNVEVQLSNI